MTTQLSLPFCDSRFYTEPRSQIADEYRNHTAAELAAARGRSVGAFKVWLHRAGIRKRQTM